MLNLKSWLVAIGLSTVGLSSMAVDITGAGANISLPHLRQMGRGLQKRNRQWFELPIDWFLRWHTSNPCQNRDLWCHRCPNER